MVAEVEALVVDDGVGPGVVLGAGEAKLAVVFEFRFGRFEQAQVQTSEAHLLVRRVGALPESANWTHQYGDIGNTLKSDDARV